MSVYSNPAITFSRDTESVYHQPKKSERQDRYEYPRRRSGDAVIGDDGSNLATLKKIRQAISAATMDHTQRSSVDPPRPSSRCHTHDRHSLTESQAVEFPEISMLGSDLHQSRMSTFRSRRRSRSTDSDDSVPSISRSPYSTTPVLPVPTLPRAENSSTAYIKSTDRYISRRNRPYASYYPKEISTYSDYDTSNQATFWDSEPSFETTHSHRSSLTTPESSIHEGVLHSNNQNHNFYANDTDRSQRMNPFSHPEHSNKQTPEANTNDIVRISRTPSLTSTEDSPSSTPSSYSDSSFITSTTLADYSITPEEETNSSFSLYHHPSPHIEQKYPTTQSLDTAEESSSITHHLSKPRRFLRTRTKPRPARPASSNADHLLQPLSTSSMETTGDRHQHISVPISPLTPSMSLPTLHFSTTTGSHSSTAGTASTSALSARSCSIYANAAFFAGLSFGIPAPELGIRLASLETMAERQEILLVRKASVSGMAW